MTISVVLPAYQEAENLKNILPNIHKVLASVNHEILVIDTMEPMDNTREICLANDVRYVPRTGGNFYGDAIRTGFAIFFFISSVTDRISSVISVIHKVGI